MMANRLIAAVLALIPASAHAQTVPVPSSVADQQSLELPGVLFSADGEFVLAHGGNLVFSWDTRAGSPVKTIEAPNAPGYSSIVESLSISGDGKYVRTTH